MIAPSAAYFDPSSRDLVETPVATALTSGTGAILGSVVGGVAGGIKEIYNKAKYGSKRKTKKEMKEIALENKLKKEDPQTYKRIKSEQKDTVRVAEGDMTKKEFKEKYGHKPKTRVYSVTITENELKLFSEFLEQREFYYNQSDVYRHITGGKGHEYYYGSNSGNDYDNALVQAKGSYLAGDAIRGGLEEASSNISKGIKTAGLGLGAGIALAGAAGAYSRIKSAKENKEKAEKKYKTSNESDFNLEKKAKENDRRLKKKDPKEYKKVKSERNDVLKVIDGKMSEDKFKEKYGHKPEII